LDRPVHLVRPVRPVRPGLLVPRVLRVLRVLREGNDSWASWDLVPGELLLDRPSSFHRAYRGDLRCGREISDTVSVDYYSDAAAALPSGMEKRGLERPIKSGQSDNSLQTCKSQSVSRNYRLWHGLRRWLRWPVDRERSCDLGVPAEIHGAGTSEEDRHHSDLSCGFEEGLVVKEIGYWQL